MAIDPMSKILQHLQRSAFRGDGTGLSDGQLLERYLNHREDAAFAALVRRHGPMVMSVCRRVLGNEHDAEDAFQACFLVLVRKAASVVPRERVGNFLYGVAHTTAVRARGLIAKRRTREKQVAQMPEPAAKSRDLWDDLRPLLDRELSRLPDKYRAPIVLCDLEGRPIKEAARQLGWPQGTLAGRLARARVMLAKRLARHGLTVSGGALAVLLCQQACSAGVPAKLISCTIEAAKRFAAGQAASGPIAAPVAALTEGVLKAMLLTKLKMATAVVMATAVLALSAAGGLYRAAAGDSPRDDAPPREEAPPASRPAKPSAAEVPPQAEERQTGFVREPLPEASDPNELPSSPMPRQVLVRLRKGQLLVQTLELGCEPFTVMGQGGRSFTTYQKVEIRRTRHCPADMVKVYDMKGKRLDNKQLPKLVKKEIVALFSTDEQAAHPLNLRLFKEGTLLFVLSSPLTPPGVVGVPLPAVSGMPPTADQGYSNGPAPVPVAPPRPAPPAGAVPVQPSGPSNRVAPREPAPVSNPAESPRTPVRQTAPNP